MHTFYSMQSRCNIMQDAIWQQCRVLPCYRQYVHIMECHSQNAYLCSMQSLSLTSCNMLACSRQLSRAFSIYKSVHFPQIDIVLMPNANTNEVRFHFVLSLIMILGATAAVKNQNKRSSEGTICYATPLDTFRPEKPIKLGFWLFSPFLLALIVVLSIMMV